MSNKVVDRRLLSKRSCLLATMLAGLLLLLQLLCAMKLFRRLSSAYGTPVLLWIHRHYVDSSSGSVSPRIASGRRCCVAGRGFTENAGVENVAPSSWAYSAFQVRIREVRASGTEVPVPHGQSPGRESGDGLKKLKPFCVRRISCTS